MIHAKNIVWNKKAGDAIKYLPKDAYINKDIGFEEIKKWLFNRYGWHVDDLDIEGDKDNDTRL